MNVNFKVYWNNPIEMSTEVGTHQLTFEVPLGTIISNPSEVTPLYPSFIGNADKVLTVNDTEDGVEWTTASGGSGGGINVIEYDPSLHVSVLDSVVGADFEPTRPNNIDDIPTSSWNPTTGVMGVANAAETEGFPNSYVEYVGLRLTPSLYGMRGSFTIDASLCEDAWGFALLKHEDGGGFPIDLWNYLTYQHYETVEDTALSQPQTMGWFLTEADEYVRQRWGTESYSSQYWRTQSDLIATKPQGVYTFNIGNGHDTYMAITGLSYEQVLEAFSANFTPEQVATVLSKTFVYNADLELYLELKADTPYLHFFMHAYHKESQTGTHLLNPTSQLTITYDLEAVGNVVPTEAVDGDFLHLLGNAKLLGKYLARGDFVQLYDNTSKMIVHANPDTVGSVGSVNGQTGFVVLDADDVGATTQAYVDIRESFLQNQINLKADTYYVDTQDGFLQNQINLKADAMAVNQSLALKADLINGLIPASQLPSYVDDVLSFPDLISFPSVGEDGKIYIAVDTNKTYRWGGSSYVEIGGGGVALGETSSTAYRGDRGKIAYDHSLSQGNPHNTTTSDITEGTKLFFTEPRVRQTVLSGLIKTNSSDVTNADTVEIAVGKLAAKSEATTTNNWVPASTVGSAATGFDISLLEFAKIDGMLFCRGFIKLNLSFAANTPVFTITNNDYKVIRPSVSATKNYSGFFNILNSVNTGNIIRLMVTGNSTDASSAALSTQVLEPPTNIASSAEWFSVNPQNACFGKLVNP